MSAASEFLQYHGILISHFTLRFLGAQQILFALKEQKV